MRKTFELMRQLGSIERYSHTHLLNPESVLEHLGFTTFLCYIICERLRECGEEIDTGLSLRKSIIHDVDEAITGDIPRPTKYYSPDIKSALDILSENATEKISGNIKITKLISDWGSAKSGKEGAVLALADILAVVHKVWQESVLYGNNSMIGHVGPTREIMVKRVNQLISKIDVGEAVDEIFNIRDDVNGMLDEIGGRQKVWR